MRQNRLSQRLKSKLDSFGFDALIKGVSTLVEEHPELVKETESADAVTAIPTPAVEVSVEHVETLFAAEVEQRDTVVALLGVLADENRVEAGPTLELRDQRPAATTAVLDPEPFVVEAPISVESKVASRPHIEPPATAAAPEPLREALLALSGRLTQEAGRMAAALDQRDAEEAGFFLAHVNQILELLHTLDGRGDISRQLGVPNAPPKGRSWPLTAWTVVEFAESPFSALLPTDAGERFVRDVIYAAWGISFDFELN